MIESLTDKAGKFAFLAACEVDETAACLKCGFIAFRGGISGDLDVYSDDGQQFTILIPDEVGDCFVPWAKASTEENLVVSLVNP